MTPQLEALERALADLFREVSTAARLADMAGLDVTQIDRSGSAADIWHSVVTLAQQDGVLAGLVERAIVERPRNRALAAAWQAYESEAGHFAPPVAGQTQKRRKPSSPMSDYRTDARIDQQQRDLSDTRAQVAGLVAQVQGMATQMTAFGAQLSAQTTQIVALTEQIKAMNDDRNQRTSITARQFWSLLAFVLLLSLLVFAIVYHGGNP